LFAGRWNILKTVLFHTSITYKIFPTEYYYDEKGKLSVAMEKGICEKE
jgi:hypothetical protein